MASKKSKKTKSKPRPRAKEKACDRAIQRTLAYSSTFKYPLSKFQLYTFLITRKKYEHKFFEKSLRRLVKGDNVKAKNGKYYLPGIRPVSWRLRRKYTKELLKEAEKTIKLLKNIPWIKMVAVTGAVASQNASKDDDIDILIVVEKNRIWLTRIFTFLILKIVGKYGHGKQDKRKFCCNLYLDESALKWKKSKRTVYVARELLSMQPLYDKNYTYLKFLEKNDWAFKHFYNYKIDFPDSYPKNNLNSSKLVDKIEDIARKLQLDYMKSKKTTEITTRHFIHFNKHDHSKEIMENYKEELSKI